MKLFARRFEILWQIYFQPVAHIFSPLVKQNTEREELFEGMCAAALLQSRSKPWLSLMIWSWCLQKDGREENVHGASFVSPFLIHSFPSEFTSHQGWGWIAVWCDWWKLQLIIALTRTLWQSDRANTNVAVTTLKERSKIFFKRIFISLQGLEYWGILQYGCKQAQKRLFMVADVVFKYSKLNTGDHYRNQHFGHHL